MFVKLRSFPGKKEPYFCLQESFRDEKKHVRTRHVAYLGKDPVTRLKKLIREGRLTEEQVAKITFVNDFSREGYALHYWLQDFRQHFLEPKQCPECGGEMIFEERLFRGEVLRCRCCLKMFIFKDDIFVRHVLSS